MIRCIYTTQPPFSANEQHPDAKRAFVDPYWVDYIGTLPTLAEIDDVRVPPTTRPLLNIIADMDAMPGAKNNAIWADLTSGTPPKWSLSTGPNAAAMAVMQFISTIAGLSAANLSAAKLRFVAMYVQDNPSYLVNPPFDTTINVPGRGRDVPKVIRAAANAREEERRS